MRGSNPGPTNHSRGPSLSSTAFVKSPSNCFQLMAYSVSNLSLCWKPVTTTYIDVDIRSIQLYFRFRCALSAMKNRNWSCSFSFSFGLLTFFFFFLSHGWPTQIKSPSKNVTRRFRHLLYFTNWEEPEIWSFKQSWIRQSEKWIPSSSRANR